MAKERTVIVEGNEGTKFRVVSRGLEDETQQPAEFFSGEIDKTGRVRVPVPILYVVVLPVGAGAIPVRFEADEFEKAVRLTP